MGTSTNDNQFQGTLLSKGFPSQVYELSDTAGLESPTGQVYGMFIPETDGTFDSSTKIDGGRLFTFTKGIPIYAKFLYVKIGSGEAGKLYKS